MTVIIILILLQDKQQARFTYEWTNMWNIRIIFLLYNKPKYHCKQPIGNLQNDCVKSHLKGLVDSWWTSHFHAVETNAESQVSRLRFFQQYSTQERHFRQRAPSKRHHRHFPRLLTWLQLWQLLTANPTHRLTGSSAELTIWRPLLPYGYR